VLFEVPDSSCGASLISLFTIIIILMSTLAFVLESVEDLKIPEKVYNVIEYISSIVFTIEYLMRMFGNGAFGASLWSFIKSNYFYLPLRSS